MKGDFWMKTRKLAAKALSVAVIATTVSGYAMAGDHSITASPSFVPWANCSFKNANTRAAAPGLADGGCAGGGDVAINFSGKVKGWSYYFDIDPSNKLDEKTDFSALGGNAGAASLGSGDMLGSVKLSKDLGNGLTLHLGDVGDGDQLKNYAGHWEAATHADPNSVGGGAQIAYSKGNINATFSYGGNSGDGNNDGSNIAFGGNMKFGKFDVGASYHMKSAGDTGKVYATKDGSTNSGVSSTSMTFGAGGSFGAYSFGVDYLSREDKVNDTYASTTAKEDTTKTTAMGVHVWATDGTFRPGLSWTSSTEKFTDASTTNGTNDHERKYGSMAVGVAWHPKDDDGYVRFIYSSVSDDQCTSTPCVEAVGVNVTEYSKMQLKVGTSVTIL